MLKLHGDEQVNAEFIVRAVNAFDALEHAAQAALFHLAEQDADEENATVSSWWAANSKVSDGCAGGHRGVCIRDGGTDDMVALLDAPPSETDSGQ